ncbi:UNVERIFIED_CONTAM: hypothetical protein ABIE34_001681 [Jeotgalibacillus campisalis]
MNEQQIRMILRRRDAYDLSGLRSHDIDVVQTPAGTTTHSGLRHSWFRRI